MHPPSAIYQYILIRKVTNMKLKALRRYCRVCVLFLGLLICCNNVASAKEMNMNFREYTMHGKFCKIEIYADAYEPSIEQVSIPSVYYDGALDLRIVDLIMPDYHIAEDSYPIQVLSNNDYAGYYSTTAPTFIALINGYPSDLTHPVETFVDTQIVSSEQEQRAVAQDIAGSLNTLLDDANFELTDAKFYAPTEEMPYGVCEYWFSQHIDTIPLYNKFIHMGIDKSGQVFMDVPMLNICVSEGKVVRLELEYASHVKEQTETVSIMNLDSFLVYLEHELDMMPIEGVIPINKITMEYTPIGVSGGVVTYRPSWCMYGQVDEIEYVLIFDAVTGELLRC